MPHAYRTAQFLYSYFQHLVDTANNKLLWKSDVTFKAKIKVRIRLRVEDA